jgi:hypothetical protein
VAHPPTSARDDLEDLREGVRRLLSDNWRTGRRDGVPYSYTCPDARKYPDQFFWDSCLHALAWSRIDPGRAMMELRTLGAAQEPSGLIGHTQFWRGPVRWQRAYTYNLSDRRANGTATIQPPLLGWVWAQVAERAGDARFAEEGLAVVRRYHAWLERERAGPDGLLGILQPDESGLDATPAYDAPLGWRAHPYPGFVMMLRFNRARAWDFRRIVADGGFHAVDALVNTGWALGWSGLERLGASEAAGRAAGVTDAMVDRLWDPGRGLFFARGPDDRPLTVSTWSGLAPLALDGLPADVGHRLVREHLLHPGRYWLPYPVPSTSADEPAFAPGDGRPLTRYWRGPTWLFTTWFVLRGLLRLGYRDEAADLAGRTSALVTRSGFREYFNPYTGQGMGGRRFSVSAMSLECAALAAESGACPPGRA